MKKMKHFEVIANLRTDLGKKATKKIRKEGNIPCVIYGKNDVMHFSTAQSAVRKLIYTPAVMFADINIDGKVKSATIKDIQFHPVSDEILHIDFYEVNEKDPIKINIPIVVEGNSPGVKAGGKLSLNNRRISVKGIMENIPDNFTINISKLNIGDSIKIKDLKSDTLEFTDPKSNIVIMVATARVVTEEETEAEAEGEEAEGEDDAEKKDDETAE
ncbi:MAG: 50S ribosomal protein L25/general stress protein Ctc [Bacteroidales bacterium]|nr:50S ribosomal protein L25/general stress protein Ctc [Bacteroidales bacterium]